uniref:Uncharacterized protein n=1 Tax=Arundo donax TaxID=35708 RepID=A0A0A9GEB3_ARUDO
MDPAAVVAEAGRRSISPPASSLGAATARSRRIATQPDVLRAAPRGRRSPRRWCPPPSRAPVTRSRTSSAPRAPTTLRRPRRPPPPSTPAGPPSAPPPPHPGFREGQKRAERRSREDKAPSL